jgi:hypothetical protein
MFNAIRQAPAYLWHYKSYWFTTLIC